MPSKRMYTLPRILIPQYNIPKDRPTQNPLFLQLHRVEQTLVKTLHSLALDQHIVMSTPHRHPVINLHIHDSVLHHSLRKDHLELMSMQLQERILSFCPDQELVQGLDLHALDFEVSEGGQLLSEGF